MWLAITIVAGAAGGLLLRKLKVPATYRMPVFIGIGYADPAETPLEQAMPDWDKQVHFGSWK